MFWMNILRMCAAVRSIEMPAVQPTSTRSQHSWLRLPSALNCPWNRKSELNNPVTEDLGFKFLFVLLCAAPTTDFCSRGKGKGKVHPVTGHEGPKVE